MSDVYCWRCARKVAEAEGLKGGKVTVICKRCSAQNVISPESVVA